MKCLCYPSIQLHPSSVHITAVLVEYPTHSNRTNRGVTTSWLKRMQQLSRNGLCVCVLCVCVHMNTCAYSSCVCVHTHRVCVCAYSSCVCVCILIVCVCVRVCVSVSVCVCVLSNCCLRVVCIVGCLFVWMQGRVHSLNGATCTRIYISDCRCQ